MTYFENSPGQGPQLWFAAVGIDSEFEASKYPYLELSYKTTNWPTTNPVKFLVTIIKSNNDLVYAYADLDPKKNFVSIDIAAKDPGWGKPYSGTIKTVQIELPHNGEPASNPATNWFNASTLLDKIAFTNTKTTGLKDIINESVSIYPNPASKSFDVIGVAANQLSIYNSSGILLKKVLKIDKNISIEGFSSGLYFVKIESEGISIVKKLVVE
jgi:hypothetical protein